MTVAPASRATDTVSSTLPPSTTITSREGAEVEAHASALSTARRTFPASFNVGTTTEIEGRWGCDFGNACCGGEVARVTARASCAAVAIAIADHRGRCAFA